jgi:hypothetical protein
MVRAFMAGGPRRTREEAVQEKRRKSRFLKKAAQKRLLRWA